MNPEGMLGCLLHPTILGQSRDIKCLWPRGMKNLHALGLSYSKPSLDNYTELSPFQKCREIEVSLSQQSLEIM